MPKYNHPQSILDQCRSIFKNINNFEPHEFKYPHLVDESALFYLDWIRMDMDKDDDILITDSVRPKGTRPDGGSKTSLHYDGRAFDIRIYNWSKEKLWRFNMAVVKCQIAFQIRIELEYVWSCKQDRPHHAHIAFYPAGDTKPSKLILLGSNVS